MNMRSVVKIEIEAVGKAVYVASLIKQAQEP